MPDEMPPPPNLDAIHSRVLQAADKLFVALEDLEAAGGLGALRPRMKPASIERTVTMLRSTHAALGEQLAKAGRKGRAS